MGYKLVRLHMCVWDLFFYLFIFGGVGGEGVIASVLEASVDQRRNK